MTGKCRTCSVEYDEQEMLKKEEPVREEQRRLAEDRQI